MTNICSKRFRSTCSFFVSCFPRDPIHPRTHPISLWPEAHPQSPQSAFAWEAGYPAKTPKIQSSGDVILPLQCISLLLLLNWSLIVLLAALILTSWKATIHNNVLSQPLRWSRLILCGRRHHHHHHHPFFTLASSSFRLAGASSAASTSNDVPSFRVDGNAAVSPGCFKL